MSTTESIQAVGGHFTTPQAWYDAHSGDITGDVNAPYIGEMKAESFASGLDMDDSVTDSTHYFHLRSQSGDEFDGDFDGSYPSIEAAIPAGYGIEVRDDYARVEHIVIKDIVAAAVTLAGVYVAGCGNVLLDTVGVFNLAMTAEAFGLGGFGIRLDIPTGPVTVRNCAVGDVTVTNIKAGQAGSCFGIYHEGSFGTKVPLYCYNNAVENLRAVGNGTEVTWGIYVASSSDAKILNNVVGTLTGDSTVGVQTSGNVSEDVQNNATTDTTGGTNSQDNITPADEFEDTTPATLDLHMKTGGQCEDNGLDLITGGYSNAPTEDCDNEVRPNPGTWSIGIDHQFIPYPFPRHNMTGGLSV